MLIADSYQKAFRCSRPGWAPLIKRLDKKASKTSDRNQKIYLWDGWDALKASQPIPSRGQRVHRATWCNVTVFAGSLHFVLL